MKKKQNPKSRAAHHNRKRKDDPVRKNTKWVWIISAAVVVIVGVTLVLQILLENPVVATLDGLNIRAEEVRGEMAWGASADDALRWVAADKLLEAFASERGITDDDVVAYIVDNPELFVEFERFMPDDPAGRANDILARINAGEDFDTLMHTYSEDPGLADFPQGYTFPPGQMVEEFEEATRALEIGEISGLVPSMFGYHIIQRIEPDPDMAMDGQEMFGAKHILVAGAGTLEERMAEAVRLGFEEKVDNAEIETRRGFENLSAN